MIKIVELIVSVQRSDNFHKFCQLVDDMRLDFDLPEMIVSIHVRYIKVWHFNSFLDFIHASPALRWHVEGGMVRSFDVSASEHLRNLDEESEY